MSCVNIIPRSEHTYMRIFHLIYLQVPEYWKRYVHEVDQEREMWLNSFYKAPLRLPMPAELEYWWSKGTVF